MQSAHNNKVFAVQQEELHEPLPAIRLPVPEDVKDGFDNESSYV